MFHRFFCHRNQQPNDPQPIINPIVQDIPEPPEDFRLEMALEEIENNLKDWECPISYAQPIVPVSARVRTIKKIHNGKEEKEEIKFVSQIIMDGRIFTPHTFEITALLRELIHRTTNPFFGVADPNTKARLFPEDINEFMKVDEEYISKFNAILLKHGRTRKDFLDSLGISEALDNFLRTVDISKLKYFKQRQEFRNITMPLLTQEEAMNEGIFERIFDRNNKGMIKVSALFLGFMTITVLHFQSLLTEESISKLLSYLTIENILSLPINLINFLIDDLLIGLGSKIPFAAILSPSIIAGLAMTGITAFAANEAFEYTKDNASWSNKSRNRKLFTHMSIFCILLLGYDTCSDFMGLASYITPQFLDRTFVGLAPLATLGYLGVFGHYEKFSNPLDPSTKSQGEIEFNDLMQNDYIHKGLRA